MHEDRRPNEQLLSINPYLLVDDVCATAEYYRDVLGKAAGLAFDSYIYVRDVDALYQEFKGKGANVLLSPTDRPHDCREIEIEDCNGYVLCFGQDLLQ